MSIDWWTLGLELVNFLVLVWLLERLLYRPVLGVLDRRQAEVSRLRDADTAAREALAAERRQVEAERAGLATQREGALEEAHRLAAAERAQARTEAQEEMQRLLADGRERLAAERAEAASVLQARGVEIGIAIARGLLERSQGSAPVAAFLAAACERVQNMDAEQRRHLLAAEGEAVPVRVVTAEALDRPRRDDCNARLESALGYPVTSSFEVEPALIAGLEVHFPGLVLRHSWRDALEAIQASLQAASTTQPEAGDDTG